MKKYCISAENSYKNSPPSIYPCKKVPKVPPSVPLEHLVITAQSKEEMNCLMLLLFMCLYKGGKEMDKF